MFSHPVLTANLEGKCTVGLVVVVVVEVCTDR